jgi:hypothetical protein
MIWKFLIFLLLLANVWMIFWVRNNHPAKPLAYYVGISAVLVFIGPLSTDMSLPEWPWDLKKLEGAQALWYLIGAWLIGSVFNLILRSVSLFGIWVNDGYTSDEAVECKTFGLQLLIFGLLIAIMSLNPR